MPARVGIYVTPTQFRTVISTGVNDTLVDACVQDNVLPFVFGSEATLWADFRTQLSQSLDIQQDDIRIVGSGRFGFSMRPGNNLRAYRDTSDIDVVVVNDALFDKFWDALLTAAYPREQTMSQIGGWLRKLQNSVYTGYLVPPDIKLDIQTFGVKANPVLALRSLWYKSFHEASEIPPGEFESLQGRIYRSWDHAKHYHRHSLIELRKSLMGASP